LKSEITRDLQNNNIEIKIKKHGCSKPISEFNLNITEFEESILSISKDKIDTPRDYIDKIDRKDFGIKNATLETI